MEFIKLKLTKYLKKNKAEHVILHYTVNYNEMFGNENVVITMLAFTVFDFKFDFEPINITINIETKNIITSRIEYSDIANEFFLNDDLKIIGIHLPYPLLSVRNYIYSSITHKNPEVYINFENKRKRSTSKFTYVLNKC